MKLLKELKRRKVFRVGIAYLTLSWLLIQIAETLLPAYGFTDAAMRILVAVLAVGLVIILVLVWIFDWTPQGVRRTLPADEIADDAEMPSQRAPNTVIAVIIVIAAVIAAFLTFRTVDNARPTDHSIAVMPFVTLGQSTADVFTDGIHVGVITRLSNVSDLNVISRTSVLSYRDSSLAMPKVAAELGAAWVLNADVQQAGEEVLISVRLADADADRQIWAQDYRRQLTATNVFEIQADIANRIFEEVDVRLTSSEHMRVERLPTGDLEAYRLYQHGRALLEQRTGSAMRNSLVYFERALELDPDYAMAWAGLANTLIELVAYEHESDPALVERAERATIRALEQDPELADAWISMGLLNYLRKDSPGAIQALKRAIQYSPSNANAHSQLSFQYALTGDWPSAYAMASRAVRLNPLSPEALANLSGSSQQSGHLDEGLEAARRASELAPGWPNTRFSMGMALLNTGDYHGAIEWLEGITVPWTGAGAETLLVQALAEAGRGNEARALFPKIEATGDIYAMAAYRAIMGELDAGYDILFELELWGDYQTIAFQAHHRDLWRPDGDDPRYDQVLKHVHETWGVKTGTTPEVVATVQ